MKMDNIEFIKLDEDDILEILIEYFQNNENSSFCFAKGCFLGNSGKDLRFVASFSNDADALKSLDLYDIDKKIDYNGDHSFLKSHPEFNLEGKN